MVQEKAWDACATDELPIVDEENKSPAPRRSIRQNTQDSEPDPSQHPTKKVTPSVGSSGKKSRPKGNPVYHVPGHEPSLRTEGTLATAKPDRPVMSFNSPSSSKKHPLIQDQAGHAKKRRTESGTAPQGQVKSTTDTVGTSDPFKDWMAARDNAAGRDEGPLTDEDTRELIKDQLRYLRDIEGKQTAYTMERLIQDGKATVHRLRHDLEYRHDTQPLKEGVRQSATWLRNFAKVGTQGWADIAAASVDKWVNEKVSSLHQADAEDIPGAEYEADQEREMLVEVKAEEKVITKEKGAIIELED
ncbi:hypothetical protein LTR24_003297 [Lithohypha guttulata]|uniref:Uncharacterized protein n=1 Tax=Lithohypha guttulata TaxID=1690604 RepID=A0ABR0KFI7_9EURO|nr:hypothetical protein LTR24_003297 [Lithohypha guttulata]